MAAVVLVQATRVPNPARKKKAPVFRQNKKGAAMFCGAFCVLAALEWPLS